MSTPSSHGLSAIGSADEGKNTDARTCTCHPDDNPPVPCARQYAYHECVAAERLWALRDMVDAFEGYVRSDMQTKAMLRAKDALPSLHREAIAEDASSEGVNPKSREGL